MKSAAILIITELLRILIRKVLLPLLDEKLSGETKTKVADCIDNILDAFDGYEWTE